MRKACPSPRADAPPRLITISTKSPTPLLNGGASRDSVFCRRSNNGRLDDSPCKKACRFWSLGCRSILTLPAFARQKVSELSDLIPAGDSDSSIRDHPQLQR